MEGSARRRNKLVHAGDPPPKWDELEDMLLAISDFLWICDFYQGYQWAANCISHATWETA
jgi:hypothetical protein